MSGENVGLLVACPTCGAGVGVHCAKGDGRGAPLWWSHRARVDAARMPGVKQRAMAMAQVQMAAITGEHAYPFVCCDYGWADVGALDRHRAAGHVPPTALGLVWTPSGWSSLR